MNMTWGCGINCILGFFPYWVNSLTNRFEGIYIYIYIYIYHQYVRRVGKAYLFWLSDLMETKASQLPVIKAKPD